jgi:hypothetical protein
MFYFHPFFTILTMRSQNTGKSPSIFSRLGRSTSEKNEKDVLDPAPQRQKKSFAAIIRSPREKKREKAENHQQFIGSLGPNSTLAPHTQLPALQHGDDEDQTEKTSEVHLTLGTDETPNSAARHQEPTSIFPIRLQNTESEGSSSQLASDDALGSPSQLKETIEFRRARPDGAKTLVRRAPKNLANIITPQNKSCSIDETQPAQMREQSSSGDELFSSGTLSPRKFPGMAELPTLDRSVKKRIAYGQGQKAEVKLDRIRKNLPAGAILDRHGNLSGRYKFTKYPATHPNAPASLIEDQISARLGKFLDFEATREIDRPAALNGILVANIARGDFHRLNYEFQNSDGSRKDLPLPTKAEEDEYLAYRNYSEDYRETANEKLRSHQIARALFDFVSDENASPEENSNTALALSSLLTQATPELLAFVVYKQQSALRMYKSKAKSKDEPAPEVTIMDSRGKLKPVIAKQFGATKFTISREGADFLIAVDFPTYAGARPGHESEVPLHTNSVLGIHISTEILIDGNAARNGVLSVKLPTGIQAEYSGRIAVTENNT